MKVYVLEFHDYEGSFLVSVWSTSELAEAAKVRWNTKFPNSPNYDWCEIEVDPDAEDSE